MTDKNSTGPILPEDHYQKTAGTSTIKVKSWIRYSLHFFKTTACLKASTTTTKQQKGKNYTKDVLFQSVSANFSGLLFTHTHTHTPSKASNDFHKIETIHRQTKQHSIALVFM